MVQHEERFVPADTSIAELERRAAECERNAKSETGEKGLALRQEAELYREWILILRKEHWNS